MKHALVGNEDVVEDDDCVDLLEARPERVVEMTSSEIEALAAEEAHAGRVAGDRERDTSTARRRRFP